MNIELCPTITIYIFVESIGLNLGKLLITVYEFLLNHTLLWVRNL